MARDVLKTEVLYSREEVASRAAEEIFHFLNQPAGSLRILIHAMNIERAPWQRQSLLSQTALNIEAAAEICLVDTLRTIQATSVLGVNAPLGRGRTLPAGYLPNVEELWSTILRKDTYISEVIIREGQPSLFIALPVQEKDEIGGALIVRFSLHDIWQKIDQIKIGETGYGVLLDEEGNYIASPARQQVYRGITHTQIEKISRERSGSLQWQDMQGTEWIAGFAPIESWGWTVVVEQQAGEAFGSIHLMQQRIKWVVGISVVGAILLGLVLLNSITRPVSQLMLAVRRVQVGQPFDLILPSRRDEFWELGKAFTEMSGNLDKRQRDLEASLDFQKQLIEDNPLGMAVLDKANNVLLKNKAWAVLLDTDKDESLEDTLEGGQIKAWLRENPTEKAIDNLEINVKEGHMRFFNLKVVELDTTYPGKFLLIVEDKTKQKLLEMRYIQTEKLSTLGEMATGVAHEIKNPLAIIQNAFDLLVRLKPDEKEERERMFEALKGAIRRINEQIGRLLDFSRPAQQMEELVDVVTVLRQLLDLERSHAEHRGILIVEDLQEPLLVHINRDLLKDIFLNLIGNAFGAMPEGGTLHIEAESHTDQVVVRVRDTGVGIPQEHINDIFKPFYSTKSPGQGTGLGLSIVHRLLWDVGGHIEVESQVGKGTCFSVYLPVIDGEEE